VAAAESLFDLSFDDAQQAVADAVTRFCAARCGDDVVKTSENRLPRELWRDLAQLGVLALLTPEGDGGAQELVAALEALGRAAFPGPLVATCFAAQLLEGEERAALAAGEALVSVGTPPLMPWAPEAQIFVALDGERAWLARPAGPVEALETLGGEPWGRVRLERLRDLPPTSRAAAVGDIARAAYLAAAGERLVDATAEHARTRRQFGRPIGEFQAVAHPLADRAVALAGARDLARAAAFHFDAGEQAEASRVAAAARAAATRAAVDAAHTCHQLFGALGITLEGPVFHVSRRIRQIASQPPDEARGRELLLAPLGL
jgi:alkylation response protein AidB-like acyl-CoA dehydrogenase